MTRCRLFAQYTTRIATKISVSRTRHRTLCTYPLTSVTPASTAVVMVTAAVVAAAATTPSSAISAAISAAAAIASPSCREISVRTGWVELLKQRRQVLTVSSFSYLTHDDDGKYCQCNQNGLGLSRVSLDHLPWSKVGTCDCSHLGLECKHDCEMNLRLFWMRDGRLTGFKILYSNRVSNAVELQENLPLIYSSALMIIPLPFLPLLSFKVSWVSRKHVDCKLGSRRAECQFILSYVSLSTVSACTTGRDHSLRHGSHCALCSKPSNLIATVFVWTSSSSVFMVQ